MKLRIVQEQYSTSYSADLVQCDILLFPELKIYL